MYGVFFRFCCRLIAAWFAPQEQVRRMLRLSEEDGAAVAEFQAMHAAAREAGFGRIFRSPTLFEDMVKCILLCNCQLSKPRPAFPFHTC